MAEPSTSAGVSLTVLGIALLGPMAGPYAVIVFAALAGAMWPLSASQTESRLAGAWLLLRITLTAVVLTLFIATIIERTWGLPAAESLGSVALAIGAIGNSWRSIWDAAGSGLRGFLRRLGGSRND
jgi:hypothetical protein